MKYHHIKSAFAVAAIGLLAACASSVSDPAPSDTGETPPPETAPPESNSMTPPAQETIMSYDEIKPAAEALYQEIDKAGMTSAADMPTTGTASYIGYGGFVMGDGSDFQLGDDVDVAAQVGMQADFATGRIEGGMTNLRTPDDEMVAGKINITDGTIDGNSFDANISGDLDYNDAATSISGTVDGEFSGKDAEMVGGVFSGNASAGGQSQQITGVIGGTRQ